MSTVTLIHGDTLRLLSSENGFRHPVTNKLLKADACISDPPYGIDFAGDRSWDTFGITSSVAARPGHAFERWCELWARPLYSDVLLPGAHIAAFSSERTVHRVYSGIEDAGFEIIGGLAWIYATGQVKSKDRLRPAYEPIALGRKTSDDKTLTQIFKKDGRGLLHTRELGAEEGKFPVNVVATIDEELDPDLPNYFFCPKASAKEKDYGCDNLPMKVREIGGLMTFKYACDSCEFTETRMGGCKDYACPTCKVGTVSKPTGEDAMGHARNTHPTAKPVNLMRRIIRLLTKPGHTVIDPFSGSFTTGVAAILEGRNFIGIEREADFVNIGRHRIAQALRDTGDNAQADELMSQATPIEPSVGTENELAVPKKCSACGYERRMVAGYTICEKCGQKQMERL